MTQVIRTAPKTSLEVKPSTVESRISGGTAGVLPAERARATFNVETLIHFLDGGPEQTKRRRFIVKQTERMEIPDKFNVSRPELLKEHVRHFIGVHESFWDTWKPTRDDFIWMMENAVMSGSLMNHYGLFLPTIEMQGSEEQKEWWYKRALRCQIIGAYAQTELGHGSNVRGLSTTAEYDKAKQQFVLNTPTLRSLKWWPGTLGKIGTHAVVYAQLIIDGKEYGVHAFMVQIRDENHKPLPGIELGDLGPKLGDHANDTGYMRMENVRIPREFMFARFQQVTPSGEYVRSGEKQKNARLHYATMMFTRGSMVKSAGGYLARAVTNAVRYSCVRRQGFIDTKKKGNSYKAAERPIIDYQVQRYRLLRQLSVAYAIKFTGSWMLGRFNALANAESRLGNVEILPEIAAVSSGLKALTTYLAWFGIEDCRKACGGNGYLMASGIASLAADYVWQTTAEGDWIILTLQTAQFLLKAVQNAMMGKPVSEVVAYHASLQTGNFDLSTSVAPAATSVKEYFDLAFLLNLFGHCALVSILNAAQNFQAKLAETQGRFDDALNSTAVELSSAVRIHCFWFMLKNFVQRVQEVNQSTVKAVLHRVCCLFACSNVLDDPIWNGIITAQQLAFVKTAVSTLLDELRPDAVSLVDAFDFPDSVLMSAIGKYDGNIYEALFQSAQRSVLNNTDPIEGYQELRPYLDLEMLKQGNQRAKL